MGVVGERLASKRPQSIHVALLQRADMVSGAILGAIAGGSAAVVGSLVQAWFNRQNTRDRIEAEKEHLQIREQKETKRRKGEFYLEKKVEILMDLYRALEESRTEYKRVADKAGYGGISDEEYDRVVEQHRQYRSVMDRASAFLSEEQREILLGVSNILYDTNGYLDRARNHPDQVDYSEFMISDFNDVFNTAEEMLKQEMREPIEDIE